MVLRKTPAYAPPPTLWDPGAAPRAETGRVNELPYGTPGGWL